jgi:hypothetical protein
MAAPFLPGPFGNGPVRLFRRSCTLDVGRANSVDLEPAFRIQSGDDKLGLTVSFRIEKTDKPEPNKSEIQIYNLTDAHQQQLQLPGVKAFLSAGYPGAEAQIFGGNVRFAVTEKKGADWVTKLELGDGWNAYSTAFISQSFQPGTSWKDVAKTVAGALGIDTGNLVDAVKSIPDVFRKGLTLHGLAAPMLTKLLEPHGLNWSIQDERIEALAPAQYLPDEAPNISPESGLIGSPTKNAPEHKGGAPVIKFRCLLNPAIRPGLRVQLTSQSIKGVFRCHKVVHLGTTRGGDWFTDGETTLIS